MFGKTFLTATALLPLALGAPTSGASTVKRDDSSALSCVKFVWGDGPFGNYHSGDVDLYANLTEFGSWSPLSETQLMLADDKTIQACGDNCKTGQNFGFEACQGGADKYGFADRGNTYKAFYGHITWEGSGDNPDSGCVTASPTDGGSLDGAPLVIKPCEYDFNNVGTSGQYYYITVSNDGTYVTRLVVEDGIYYGPSPDVDNGTLTLTSGSSTSFGFRS
ncbi:hypothetical protein IAT38_003003 [Cryptococcus sp. DSM 104549]